MFERFRKHDDQHEQRSNGVAVRAPEAAPARHPDGVREPSGRRNGEPVAPAPAPAAGGTATVERPRRRPVADRAADEAQLRRREEFGGLNWGAAFFGWLVAIGLAALLVAIVAAAGTALGLSEI